MGVRGHRYRPRESLRSPDEVGAFLNSLEARSSGDFTITSSDVGYSYNPANWGTYPGGGYHFYRYAIFPWAQWERPATSFEIEMQQGDEPCNGEDPWGDLQPDCTEGESPIIADLNHDGFHVTSAADGVRFDIDGNGTVEWVAWTKEGDADAFLARDVNHNGVVDSGLELFGNHTRVAVHDLDFATPSGFDALQFFDLGVPGVVDGRGDGRLSSADPAFPELLLWTDTNHNGLSEPTELRNASAEGLVSIDVFGVRESRQRDRFGNHLMLFAKSAWVIDGRAVTTRLSDVWFVVK